MSKIIQAIIKGLGFLIGKIYIALEFFAIPALIIFAIVNSIFNLVPTRVKVEDVPNSVNNMTSVLFVIFILTTAIIAISLAVHYLRENEIILAKLKSLIDKDKPLVFVLGVIIGFLLGLIYVLPERKKRRAKKTREKYPGLSVVGVFANRLENSIMYASSLLVITASVYLTISIRQDMLWFDAKVPIAFAVCYVGISLNRFITRYRIKKGYYLDNESDARELVNFIRDNADDIDFTGNNKKIISERDLEDIVLNQMRRVPLN